MIHPKTALLLATLLAGLSQATAEPEGPRTPDRIVLHTGEVVPCSLRGFDGSFVLAQIGDRTYRIERSSLGAAPRGVAGPDVPQAHIAFVLEMGRHLTGADERLRAAALAAFQAWGTDRAALLKAAAPHATPPVREALQQAAAR